MYFNGNISKTITDRTLISEAKSLSFASEIDGNHTIWQKDEKLVKF